MITLWIHVHEVVNSTEYTVVNMLARYFNSTHVQVLVNASACTGGYKHTQTGEYKYTETGE